MKTQLIFLSSLVVLTSFALIDQQDAFADYQIGIKHDKTCQALIAAGDTWTCPTFEEISELFLEVELKPEYQNLIDNEENRINQITNNAKVEKLSSDCIRFDLCYHFTKGYWKDPSDFLSRSMDTITITANMKIQNAAHLKYSDIAIITADNKREINFELNQLYISSNCKDAIFNPGSDWQYELGHLIYYMKLNCNDPSILTRVFDMNYTVTTEIHDYDPLTSPNYQYRLWMEQAKDMCKVKC